MPLQTVLLGEEKYKANKKIMILFSGQNMTAKAQTAAKFF